MNRTQTARLAVTSLAVLLAACGSSRKVSEGGDEPHPEGFAAVHGQAALADLESCKNCHGTDYGGAFGPSCNACHQQAGYPSWASNCTFCHGSQRTASYTPADLPKSAPTSGSHPGHASNTPCAECHVVPTSLAHVDGAVQVQFGPFAKTGGLNPLYAAPTCSSVYCHGAGIQSGGGTATSPSWGATLACTSCHASPPPTASPLTPNNGHLFHDGIGVGCATCHPGYTATTVGAKHLNGVSEYTDLTGTEKTDGWNGVPAGQGAGFCANCHGG